MVVARELEKARACCLRVSAYLLTSSIDAPSPGGSMSPAIAAEVDGPLGASTNLSSASSKLVEDAADAVADGG